MKLNLRNSTPKATTRFALNSKAEVPSDIKMPCPFCQRPDVAIGGSGGLDQHLYYGGFHFCEASGKSPEKARLLRLDENFNVVYDDDPLSVPSEDL